MNKNVWRLLDTGFRSGAENMALDHSILTSRAEGMSPNTLRFLQFSPPVALVGYHQSVSEEIRESYCKQAGIDINRRITGGGTIYFDEGQLGWEIICSYEELGIGLNLQRLTAEICKAATNGLRQLGVDAEFRPRNDIEVNGRKISGTGGAFDGDCFLFQGTLLIDFNLENLIKALRIPTEKLNREEFSSASERVTSLKEQLKTPVLLDDVKSVLASAFQTAFGFQLHPEGLTAREKDIFKEQLPRVMSNSWIYGDRLPMVHHQVLRSIYKEDGGLIRVAAKVDVDRMILRDVLITGDFFIRPKRTIFDLETALKNRHLDKLESIIHDFFASRSCSLLDLTAKDFVCALDSAVSKLAYIRYGLSMEEANTLTCMKGRFEEILPKCEVLLLPYCSKLPECTFRFRQGCKQCGKCTIGTAYAMAEQAGLRVKDNSKL